MNTPNFWKRTSRCWHISPGSLIRETRAACFHNTGDSRTTWCSQGNIMSSFRHCIMPQPARAYPANWVDTTAHNRNWQTTGGDFREYERFCLFKTPWACFCHLWVSSSDTVIWHVHGPRQTLNTKSYFHSVTQKRTKFKHFMRSNVIFMASLH